MRIRRRAKLEEIYPRVQYVGVACSLGARRGRTKDEGCEIDEQAEEQLPLRAVEVDRTALFFHLWREYLIRALAGPVEVALCLVD